MLQRLRSWLRWRGWVNDLRVFERLHGDLYSLAGLELALLHLTKLDLPDLSAAARRQQIITTRRENIEILLLDLQLVHSLIVARNSMPPTFQQPAEPQSRSVDDFFVTNAGHIAHFGKLVPSVMARTTQLLSDVRGVEHEDSTYYGHCNRKLRPLYQDLFEVLVVLIRNGSPKT